MTAAVAACVTVIAVFGALLWPASLGPKHDPAVLAADRERLAQVEAALDRGLGQGPEVRLSIDEGVLSVLLSDLAGEAVGTSVALRIRAESVAVDLEIPVPAGLRVHARLVMQPSLLDGRVFLGLREVRLGLLPVPPGWLVSRQAAAVESGWVYSRGTPGYVLPGLLWHQGVLLEVVDVWCADGRMEVVLRKVVAAGGR